jgi:hypothetical protein
MILWMVILGLCFELSWGIISLGEKRDRRRIKEHHQLESECTTWCTKLIKSNSGDLEKLLLQTGFYVPWGIPFKTFDEVHALLSKKKILIIGDSYSKNMYIELVDMWYGIARQNQLTANNAHGQKLNTRNKWLNLAKELCDADEDFNIEYAGSPGPVNRIVKNALTRDRIGMNHTSAEIQLDRARVSDYSNYGIGSMFHFHLLLQKYSEHVSKLLRSYDLVVIGCMVHDLELKQKWVTFGDRSEQFRRSLTSVHDALDAWNVTNTIWIGAKSYNNTGTPQEYIDAQFNETLEYYFREVAEQHNKSWIDHLAYTGSCSWHNCSLADHHHNRFVNRVKALHVLDVARQNGFL